MAQQAHITSIEPIEAFRATLILYLTKARRVLDDVDDSVRRTRAWVEGEQRARWETEIRLRGRKLEQLQQDLFGARIASLRRDTAGQQSAVNAARGAVREAEEKLRVTRRWARDFDAETGPLTKRLEEIRHVIDHELPKAAALLVEVQKLIESYAEVRPGTRGPGEGDAAGGGDAGGASGGEGAAA